VKGFFILPFVLFEGANILEVRKEGNTPHFIEGRFYVDFALNEITVIIRLSSYLNYRIITSV